MHHIKKKQLTRENINRRISHPKTTVISTDVIRQPRNGEEGEEKMGIKQLYESNLGHINFLFCLLKSSLSPWIAFLNPLVTTIPPEAYLK